MNNTQKQTSRIVSFLLISPLFITGCDTFRNTFGLDHYSPDEMSTAAPSPGLILPPDFAERPKLPPPTPGSPNPHVIPDSVKAKKTVLGDDASQEPSASTTKGEKDIIEKASESQTVTPNIRSIIDEESQTDSTVSGKVISKIKSWKKEVSDNLSTSKPKTKISEAENPSQNSKMADKPDQGDS